MPNQNEINGQAGSVNTTALTVSEISGDTEIELVNATASQNFTLGVDSATGNLQLGDDLSLSTVYFNMDDAGGRTLPRTAEALLLQGSRANITGDGTSIAMGAATLTEIIDQNNDFVTGTWTAPATGVYFLQAGAAVNNAPAISPTDTQISFITSNRTFVMLRTPSRGRLSTWFGGNNDVRIGTSALMDMDDGDTATLNLICSGGTKQQGFAGSYFNFWLVG